MLLREIVQVNRISLTFRRHHVKVIFAARYRSVNTPPVTRGGTEVTQNTESEPFWYTYLPYATLERVPWGHQQPRIHQKTCISNQLMCFGTRLSCRETRI